ncbi:helix-turn-helix domain-containing protein [Frondihabitans australicus]|uniref:XRE family transcriptional regulator n=1 Tax=Frondihabitans australicus TaxID=386892 RepID=A0A495IIU6_9MICO|nr:XRE family transcriptional regulator [Frondihabitans australicus]RKR75231.1 XRE family transcriptional regulator [Frondihabitans australicus]
MPADTALDSALGRVLRAARRAAGLTLAQLAERAGVSQPHLSQMENGKASPSIATLFRLADALGVTPQDLLPPTDASEVVVVRRGSPTPSPMSDLPNAARVHVLVSAPGRDLQVDEVVGSCGDDLGGWFAHDGEEFLYVVEGSLTLEIERHETLELGLGDSVWFDSGRSHRWTSSAPGGVRILVINGAAARPHTL